MDRFCLRRMEMATLYEENGRDDLAAAYYREIIAAYPDSIHAEEARRRLADTKPKP